MAADLKMEVGARLRAARRRAKLSQEALAERVGRSVDGISNMERGVNLPSLDALIEICRALAISVADLLEGLQSEEASDQRRELEHELKALSNGMSLEDLTLVIDLVGAVRRRRAG